MCVCVKHTSISFSQEWILNKLLKQGFATPSRLVGAFTVWKTKGKSYHNLSLIVSVLNNNLG